MSFAVHCRNPQCGKWLGESPEPLTWRATMDSPQDREVIPGPRYTWRCGKCGQAHVFRPYTEDEVRRKIVELKLAS